MMHILHIGKIEDSFILLTVVIKNPNPAGFDELHLRTLNQ